MIRINVVGELSDVARAALKYHAEHRAKSYGDRNPGLGKMVNCGNPGCVLGRHRGAVVHADLTYSTARYELDAETGLQLPEDEKTILIAPKTRNGIIGAAHFKGKRVLHHRHPRTLEAKDVTNELFDADLEFAESFPNYQPDITRSVREAIRIINTRLQKRARKAQKAADLSRRINRGLANPGSRL
jgi:hypothetical protein